MLARTFDLTGLNALLIRAQRGALGPHIRSVNYHDVPPARAADFERQLRLYARYFEPVGMAELQALREGRWNHQRPGLILSFDDGLRSHAEVVAPALERHGFTGWFFVPVGFVDTPEEAQLAYARERSLSAPVGAREGERVAMSWEQLRAIDRRHVVGCHTWHHRRLEASLDPDELEREIPAAKRRLEERLGHRVEVFAWVGGEEWAYSAAAARAIRQAGFSSAFMTNNAVIRPQTDPLQLQRTNVEADYPLHLTRFQLCGFLDLTYTPKRRRVNRLTAA